MSKNSKSEARFDDVAVAIRYAFGQTGETPKIVASGRGLIARQIVELAKANSVPLKQEKALAESLAKVPVGIEIPPELWGAMAEILAQVYLLDHKSR
jgi:flagellar biosynthesis protein